VYVDAMIARDRDTDANGTLDQRLYVMQDANFNVTALVDISGSVVERYVYDAFGAVTVLDASWAIQSGGSNYVWVYLHQGGRFDSVSGLYNFRNRDYSPTLGRWVTMEPIGTNSGTNNLYECLENDPLTSLEPSGLKVCVIAIEGFLGKPKFSYDPLGKIYKDLATNAVSTLKNQEIEYAYYGALEGGTREKLASLAKNKKANDFIVIVGYSWGGARAVDLTRNVTTELKWAPGPFGGAKILPHLEDVCRPHGNAIDLIFTINPVPRPDPTAKFPGSPKADVLARTWINHYQEVDTSTLAALTGFIDKKRDRGLPGQAITGAKNIPYTAKDLAVIPDPNNKGRVFTEGNEHIFIPYSKSVQDSFVNSIKA